MPGLSWPLRAPETDVVIVTAFDDSAVRTVAMQDGAAAFVAKHEAAQTLVGTIHRIFADKQEHSARSE
jgi:DNA-binding NarL/FixJ family response regulator